VVIKSKRPLLRELKCKDSEMGMNLVHLRDTQWVNSVAKILEWKWRECRQAMRISLRLYIKCVEKSQE
jgi:hypothetical protein